MVTGYQEHMTATKPGDWRTSNYVVNCICGWWTHVAATDDLTPAQVALDHVRATSPRRARDRAQMWFDKPAPRS